MKPIATGAIKSDSKLVSLDAIILKEAAYSTDPLDLINPIIYKEPLAPYTAAKISRIPNKTKKIFKSYFILRKKYDFMIVEGIGGIMVPISKNYIIADLIKKFNLPVVIISRPELGTINHTLLTLECAKKFKLKVEGIIFNSTLPIRKTISSKTNPEIIKKISNTEILGIMPFSKNIKNINSIAKRISRYIDLEKILII